MALFIRIVVALVAAYQVSSFSPSSSYTNNNIQYYPSSSSQLFSLIRGEAFGSEPFDEDEGGVGLAKRCAIKVMGVAKGSDEDNNAEPQELLRYEKLHEVSNCESIMDKQNVQLLCSGQGKEEYQDPGKSNRVEDRVIKLAPIEAVQNALNTMASSVTIGEDNKSSVVINFLGGDDLIIGEVLQATDMLVGSLDFPPKTKVKFNSLSFCDIAQDVCSVTVVVTEGKTGGLEGVERNIAKGEVYAIDGKWYTTDEDDIISFD